MNLFTYLMSKKGYNYLPHKDLFSYLLGKNNSIKTETGSEITINSIRGLLKSIKLTKESTQETTTGKNLLNINGTITKRESANYSNISTSNNTLSYSVTDATAGYLGFVIPTEIGTQYVISYTNLTGGLRYIELDTKITQITNEYGTSIGSNFSYTATKPFVGIWLQVGGNSSGSVSNLQLEKGTTATEYEPYTGGQPSPNPDYPQEIKTVKGYRNLFDKNSATSGNFVNQYGNMGTDATAFVSDYIEITPNTDYYISDRTVWDSVGLYDNNKTFLERIRLNSSTGIVNISNTSCKYIRINADISNLNIMQLNKGNLALPYVPYGTNWIYVKVTNGTDTNYFTIPFNGNEICGIGDYKDELIVDSDGHCYLNKKIGKVVLDGSESWIYQSTNTRFVLNYTGAVNGGDLYCNHYIKGDTAATNNTIQMSANYIYIKDTRYSKTDNYENWLSNNNTIVYYVLETPDPIDLNYTIDMTIFKGTNTITNSADADMIIEYI